MRITQIRPDIARKLEAIYCLDLPQLAQQGLKHRATIQRIVRLFALKAVEQHIKQHPGCTLEDIVEGTEVVARLVKEILLLLVHRQQVELQVIREKPSTQGSQLSASAPSYQVFPSSHSQRKGSPKSS